MKPEKPDLKQPTARSMRFALPVACLTLAVVSVALTPVAEGVRTRPVHTRPGAPALRVVGHADTGVNPKSVHLNPSGSRAWVPNFGFMGHDNVYVYDSETLQQVGTVTFPGNAVEVTFTHDGQTAFVSNFRRGNVERVNPRTFAVEDSVHIGANPKYMVVSADNRTLYAAAYSGMAVAVIDIETFEIVRRLRTGRRPRGMTLLPDGRLLVASFSSDFIQVFNPETGRELRRFNTCPMPRHLQMRDGDSRVFVTCTRGSIGVYNVETGRRLIHAHVGTNPRSLDLSPDGRFAVTANFGSDNVSVYDIEAGTHRTSDVPGADHMVGVAAGLRRLPSGENVMRVFATSWNTNTLFALEPE